MNTQTQKSVNNILPVSSSSLMPSSHAAAAATATTTLLIPRSLSCSLSTVCAVVWWSTKSHVVSVVKRACVIYFSICFANKWKWTTGFRVKCTHVWQAAAATANTEKMRNQFQRKNHCNAHATFNSFKWLFHISFASSFCTLLHSLILSLLFVIIYKTLFRIVAPTGSRSNQLRIDK